MQSYRPTTRAHYNSGNAVVVERGQKNVVAWPCNHLQAMFWKHLRHLHSARSEFVSISSSCSFLWGAGPRPACLYTYKHIPPERGASRTPLIFSLLLWRCKAGVKGRIPASATCNSVSVLLLFLVSFCFGRFSSCKNDRHFLLFPVSGLAPCIRFYCLLHSKC